MNVRLVKGLEQQSEYANLAPLFQQFPYITIEVSPFASFEEIKTQVNNALTTRPDAVGATHVMRWDKSHSKSMFMRLSVGGMPSGHKWDYFQLIPLFNGGADQVGTEYGEEFMRLKTENGEEISSNGDGVPLIPACELFIAPTATPTTHDSSLLSVIVTYGFEVVIAVDPLTDTVASLKEKAKNASGGQMSYLLNFQLRGKELEDSDVRHVLTHGCFLSGG